MSLSIDLYALMAESLHVRFEYDERQWRSIGFLDKSMSLRGVGQSRRSSHLLLLVTEHCHSNMLLFSHEIVPRLAV